MTESDLYAMGMESPTAWHKMAELCAFFGVPYPPENRQPLPVNELADPLEEAE